jgi:GntR family transcriptional regulator
MTTRTKRALSPNVVKLQRDSHVALHQQLAQHLREEIANGTYGLGAKIPPEPELARRHGVSRITARQAVMHLVYERLVIRRQGKGTFVAAPPVLHDLADLHGIYDELVARGINPTTRLLAFAEVVAPANVAERLRSGKRKVLHWKRLYLKQGEPFAVSSVHLAPGLPKLTRQLVDAHSSYHLFEFVMHLHVSDADLSVRARAATPELQGLLRLGPRDPVIVLERVSHAAGGRPLEHTLYYANAENYEFALKLRGSVPLTSSIKSRPGST